MKGLWAIVVAIVLTSCGTNQGFSDTPAPAWNQTFDETGWWRRIRDRRPYPDVKDLPTGFRRTTDPVAGPIYLLFADDGTVCVVDDATFVMARDGDEFRCVWRRWR